MDLSLGGLADGEVISTRYHTRVASIVENGPVVAN